MRVVDKPADAAIDPWTDDEGGVTHPSGAGSSAGGAGPGRGPDVVGLRSRANREGAGRLGSSPSPSDGHGRPSPGSPAGPRETAKYGFGLCASGKPRTPDPLARTSGIWTASSMLLWLLRGWPAYTSLWLACVLNIRPSRLRGSAWSRPIRQATRRGSRHLTRLGRLGVPGPGKHSDGGPHSSDGGGTSHRTSQTTTSSFFARIRGDAGAGTGEGHDTPPPAFGSGDEGPWSLSPGSPDEGT